jgi:hypothetical protein
MYKKMMPLAIAAGLFAGANASLIAQSAVDGAIGGTVQDKTGAIVPNAAVTIHSNATNAEQKVTADASGFFRVIHLNPGTYTVTITATGFDAYKSNNVGVHHRRSDR